LLSCTLHVWLLSSSCLTLVIRVDRPLTPDHVPWHELYPAYIGPGNVPLPAAAAPVSTSSPDSASASSSSSSSRSPLSEVRIADVGCGFGGMTVALGEIFRDKLVLGLEIREKVVEILKGRIQRLRKEAKEKAAQDMDTDASSSSSSSSDGESYLPTASASPSPAPWSSLAPSSYKLPAARPFDYQNIEVVRVNFMKYAPNYFRRGQLEAMFILFADPHFKKANFRRRVISKNFLDIYAHVLKIGGMLYTITDVLALHEWEVEHLDAHPLFERIPNDELKDDPCFVAMHWATEEGQKVTRLSGQKWAAVYRRIAAKGQ